MHILRNVIHRLFEAAGDDGAAGGEGADNSNQQADAQRTELETRAKEMGWSAKAQWRGDPNNWIDAPEFVKRGEQVLPILQANSRKDRAELETLRRQVTQQSTQLAAANESIQVLTNLHTEQGRQAAKEKRRELLRAQAAARTEGNAELEIDLGEQIADVTSQINAAAAEGEQTGTRKAPKPGTQQPQQNEPVSNPTADPDYQAFVRENSWFGTDRRRTAMATAIGEELRSDHFNDGLQGKAFFDRVAAEVNKVFAPPRTTTSKVEGMGNGSGQSNSNGNNSTDPATGKSYADLPDDAKKACERQANLLVGEGKAFKDIAAWRKHYVTVYFNS